VAQSVVRELPFSMNFSGGPLPKYTVVYSVSVIDLNIRVLGALKSESM
jgi:hypothetical protein